jgi:hypothetical protein
MSGVLGMVVFEGETIRASLSFGFDAAGALSDFYNMRIPVKFAGLSVGTESLH